MPRIATKLWAHRNSSYLLLSLELVDPRFRVFLELSTFRRIDHPRRSEHHERLDLFVGFSARRVGDFAGELHLVNIRHGRRFDDDTPFGALAGHGIEFAALLQFFAIGLSEHLLPRESKILVYLRAARDHVIAREDVEVCR